MPIQTIARSELAKIQLKTAIQMFFEGRDCFSVITLAGASIGIFTQLLINNEKSPFVDDARKIQRHLSGRTVSRATYQRHIKSLMGISALRHHAPNEPLLLELDEKKCAIDSLVIAVSDYAKLFGTEDEHVSYFLQWYWLNHNGKKMMDEFTPEKAAIFEQNI